MFLFTPNLNFSAGKYIFHFATRGAGPYATVTACSFHIGHSVGKVSVFGIMLMLTI